MPLARLTWLTLLLALGTAPAAAAETWVESQPMDSKSDARETLAGLDLDALTAAVGGAALEVGVQRRFVQDVGWGYVVRVEGLADEAQARRAADWLAQAGVAATLWTRDGSDVQRLGATTPGAGSRGLQPPVPRLEGDAHKVVRQAIRAHGGARGGVELVQGAPAVSFDFERRVPMAQGELLAANRYRRMGEAVRLEVDIVEGEGSDSRTVLTPANEAWVRAGEEPPVAREPARTLEVLARFSPEGVLAIPLGLARDLETAAEWEGVVLAGEEQAAGRRLQRLEPAEEGAPADGLVAAWFDAESGRLDHVQWATSTGVMEFRFADYRELVEGLVVPHDLTVLRDGAVVERVRVLALSLEEALDPALFETP